MSEGGGRIREEVGHKDAPLFKNASNIFAFNILFFGQPTPTNWFKAKWIYPRKKELKNIYNRPLLVGAVVKLQWEAPTTAANTTLTKAPPTPPKHIPICGK